MEKNPSIETQMATKKKDRKTQQENKEAQKAKRENTKATEKNTKAKGKSTKAAKAQSAAAISLGKVTSKIDKNLEGAAGNVKGFSTVMDTVSSFLGDKTVKSIVKFTGSLGLAASVTKKYATEIISINRALPGFNEGIGDAISVVGEGMFKTGLDLEKFGRVVRSNGLAFRKFGNSIINSVQSNEALRLSMGIGREAMVELTAAAANSAARDGVNAKDTEALSKFSRKYILNLNELALQTGRQTDEIIASRVSNAQGSANFIAELSKEGAVIFQGALEAAEAGGADFAKEFAGIFAGNSVERLNNSIDVLRGVKELDAKNELLSIKEKEQLSKDLVAASQGDAEAAKRAQEALTKFQIGLNTASGGVAKNQILQSKFALAAQAQSANIGKIQQTNNSTVGEAAAAQLKGQKEQLARLEKFFDTKLGKLGIAFNNATNLVGNFGGDISSMFIAIIGLKNGLDLAKSAGKLLGKTFGGLSKFGSFLMKGLSKAGSGLLKVFKFLGKGGRFLLKGLNLLSKSGGLLLKAFNIVRTVLAVLFSPIGLAVGLLAVAVLAVINNFDAMIGAFKDFPFLVESVFDDIKSFFFGGEKSEEQKESDKQERDLVRASLERQGKESNKAAVDAAIKVLRAGSGADEVSFFDSLVKFSKSGLGFGDDEEEKSKEKSKPGISREEASESLERISKSFDTKEGKQRIKEFAAQSKRSESEARKILVENEFNREQNRKSRRARAQRNKQELRDKAKGLKPGETKILTSEAAKTIKEQSAKVDTIIKPGRIVPQGEKIAKTVARNAIPQQPVAQSVATSRDATGSIENEERSIGSNQKKERFQDDLAARNLRIQQTALLDNINKNMSKLAGASRNNPGGIGNRKLSARANS